eukprot:7389340-Prymnesium_polylepis.1
MAVWRRAQSVADATMVGAGEASSDDEGSASDSAAEAEGLPSEDDEGEGGGEAGGRALDEGRTGGDDGTPPWARGGARRGRSARGRASRGGGGRSTGGAGPHECLPPLIGVRGSRALAAPEGRAGVKSINIKRGTLLGNPFPLPMGTGRDGAWRAMVVDLHRRWLQAGGVRAADMTMPSTTRHGREQPLPAEVQPRRSEASLTGNMALRALEGAYAARGGARWLRLECS